MTYKFKLTRKFTHRFVYGFYRDGKYLYIGCTTTGMVRLDSHNIIGKEIVIKSTDELHLWSPDEPNLLHLLETSFIQIFTPLLNRDTRKYKTVKLSQLTYVPSVILRPVANIKTMPMFLPTQQENNLFFSCVK